MYLVVIFTFHGTVFSYILEVVKQFGMNIALKVRMTNK